MLSTMFPRAHTRYESLPLLSRLWEGFCEWLHERGYPTDAIQRRLRAGRKLEDVLRKRRVRSLDRLTASELRALVPHPTCWSEQLVYSLVRSLAEYLEEQGRLVPAPINPIGELVSSYCRYLKSVRGLAPSTVVRKGWIAAEFMQFLDYDGDSEKLHGLKIADVEAFIARVGRRLGRASMQKVTATLRSFLRFLAAEGEAPTDLDALIDSPRCFRGERLPRALPWSSVRSLLRSVDRTTPKGRRDYAMLLLIVTYGLRVSEVAALTLDDLSWRSQQIRVPRPKVGTPLVLPLTVDVATALLDYIRNGRSDSSHRHIFLRVRKPSGPIQSSAVSDAFDVWAARAGIELPKRAGGPHCLRHSLAVHLLRQGTSVKTIGDLLGHRSAESTCVYLRLQVEDLRDVALPLPQAVGSAVQP